MTSSNSLDRGEIPVDGVLGSLSAVLDRLTLPAGVGIHASAVPGLYLNRISTTVVPKRTLTDALVCVAAQGSEKIHIGATPYVCVPGCLLLVAHNFPLVREFQATKDGRPYLGLTLLLDIPELTRLMQEINSQEVRP